ncbi:hypothetical protein [Streptomyces mirabilis]|uniref:hypothetical protein n=1 Tax=Streptomyces mirabilis TaxID=68239 RepID=UPI003405C1FE
MEADAVAWLRDLVTGWSTPRLGTSSPLGVATTAPGGSALLSLTAWASSLRCAPQTVCLRS